MPIKGLSDRGMSFPQIGNIRKGVRMTKVNGVARQMLPTENPDTTKNYPKEVPHFVVEFDDKETEAAGKFNKLYGDKPTELNIVFPFNEIDKQWDVWYEAYTAGRMVARSDGEYFLYLVNVKTGAIEVQNGEPKVAHREIVGEYDKVSGGKEKIAMKPTGRLKVILPILERLAFLVVHTGSIHDIINISGQLESIQSINGGRIAGIPLVLRRRPKEISVPKDGKRVRMIKHLLSVEADPEWVKLKLSELKHNSLPGNGFALLPEAQPAKVESADVAGPEWVDDDDEGEEIKEGAFVEQPETTDDFHLEAPTVEQAAKAITSTDYFSFCYGDLKYTSAQAKEVLVKFGGDFTAAMAHLQPK